MIKELKRSSCLPAGEAIESVVLKGLLKMDMKRKRSSILAEEELLHERSTKISFDHYKSAPWSRASSSSSDGDFDEEIALANAYRSRSIFRADDDNNRDDNNEACRINEEEEDDDDDDGLLFHSPVSTFQHPTIMRARTICESPPSPNCGRFFDDNDYQYEGRGNETPSSEEETSWRSHYADQEQEQELNRPQFASSNNYDSDVAAAADDRDAEEERRPRDGNRTGTSTTNNFFRFQSAALPLPASSSGRGGSPGFPSFAFGAPSPGSGRPLSFRAPPLFLAPRLSSASSPAYPPSVGGGRRERVISLDWEAELASAAASAHAENASK